MSICYLNGSYQTKFDARISIQDRGFNFSDGVYEVMSFSNTKVINFQKHINRLNLSLKELKIHYPFKNSKTLKLILNKLIKLNKLNHGFLYLQITRGSASRNHLFPKITSPNIVIFTFNTKIDDKHIIGGVKVNLTSDKRWSRCDIKSISLLPNVLEKQNASENGYYESWQIRNNYITEGSTSNAFIINKKNEIQTHPTNNFILGGVTRDSVIEVAKRLDLKIREEAFTACDINTCKEAFLTSTTVRILPVIKIQKNKINNGKPGFITRKLISEYNNFINSQINGKY